MALRAKILSSYASDLPVLSKPSVSTYMMAVVTPPGSCDTMSGSPHSQTPFVWVFLRKVEDVHPESFTHTSMATTGKRRTKGASPGVSNAKAFICMFRKSTSASLLTICFC